MGDVRIEKKWLDSMLDCFPVSGITATPVSGGSAAATAVTLSASSSRIQPASLLAPASSIEKNYLGMMFAWTDNFSLQTTRTRLISWSLEGVAQPLSLKTWESIPTAHGIDGYHHIRKLILAYKSTAAITLTITAYDGISPSAITLPSTSGTFQKVEFIPSYNKGMLFTYKTSSAQPYSFNWDSCEVHVGSWERSSAYAIFRDLGGKAV